MSCVPIIETRDDYFARHGVEPCRECLKRDRPGSGIAPIVGRILMDVYVDKEIDRLARLEGLSDGPDNHDRLLKERSRHIYVRACWLINHDPVNDI